MYRDIGNVLFRGVLDPANTKLPEFQRLRRLSSNDTKTRHNGELLSSSLNSPEFR